jgi:hypothetical protein
VGVAPYDARTLFALGNREISSLTICSQRGVRVGRARSIADDERTGEIRPFYGSGGLKSLWLSDEES